MPAPPPFSGMNSRPVAGSLIAMTAPRFLPTNMLTAMFPQHPRQQPNIRQAEVQERKAAWKAGLAAKEAAQASSPQAPKGTKS